MIFKILLMKIEENKQMRRAKRQVTDIDLIKKFVDEVEVVRIAINGEKYPYVVPVNFGYSWNDEALSLYIHGASEGKKVSMIRENPLVAVEMDQPDKIIEGNKNASTYSYAYQSLIGFGEAKIIEDLEEKRNALHLLMAHAAKGKKFDPIPEKTLERVGVIKIIIDSYTVKQNIHPDKKREEHK